jgi:hypothetical protein
MENSTQIAMAAAGDFAPWTCPCCESQNNATTIHCEVCSCLKWGCERPTVVEVTPMTDDELWDMYNSDGSFHKFDVECECSTCNSFR